MAVSIRREYNGWPLKSATLISMSLLDSFLVALDFLGVFLESVMMSPVCFVSFNCFKMASLPEFPGEAYEAVGSL